MTTSRLDNNNDWTFGAGRANYITRSGEIRQNVVTRLKLIKNDWFPDITAGLDWFNILGQSGNQDRVLQQIERQVLQTDGVVSITKLDLRAVDVNRGAVIVLQYRDIFDEEFDLEVNL